jgi:hypothetical protein
MARATEKQLDEVKRRTRRLPPGDPQFIPREKIQALLDGHLVVGEGRIIPTAELVERMIKAGLHKATNGGRGMKASAYRKMWPRTVVQPVSYAGRFDQILLVDLAIDTPRLAKMANFCRYVRPLECRDFVPAPTGKDGKPVSRYIAFVQLGKNNLNRTVEDCRKTFAPDEVGLVTAEGLHLSTEHEAHLRRYAAELAGSAYGEMHAPYVGWFGDCHPYFHARGIRDPLPDCGSASRGSEVVILVPVAA